MDLVLRPGRTSVFTLGPFLAALIMASVTGGSGGLRDVASRILRWRVKPIWYAAALLVPIGIGLTTAASIVLLGAPTSSAARPGSWYSPVLLFATLLCTGDTLCEETGWRAFALPRFSAGRSPLANTLILGVLVAGWHLPVALSESGALVPYLLAATASTVIINWVYYGGRESALLAWLYHTSANTTGLYFSPLFSGPNRVTYFWMLAGVNLVAAILLVLATGPDLGRHRASQ
jgi:hypothetical protein